MSAHALLPLHARFERDGAGSRSKPFDPVQRSRIDQHRVPRRTAVSSIACRPPATATTRPSSRPAGWPRSRRRVTATCRSRCTRVGLSCECRSFTSVASRRREYPTHRANARGTWTDAPAGGVPATDAAAAAETNCAPRDLHLGDSSSRLPPGGVSPHACSSPPGLGSSRKAARGARRGIPYSHDKTAARARAPHRPRGGTSRAIPGDNPRRSPPSSWPPIAHCRGGPHQQRHRHAPRHVSRRVSMNLPKGFAVGRVEAGAALSSNPPTTRRAWLDAAPRRASRRRPARVTLGVMTLTLPDKPCAPRSTWPYWIKDASGWKVAAYSAPPPAQVVLPRRSGPRAARRLVAPVNPTPSSSTRTRAI